MEYTTRHTCKLSKPASFPFQKPSLPPIPDLTSSSSSSSPSLAAAAAGAKVDDQSPEKGRIFNGDLDLPQEGTQVHDHEMLDDWDRVLDDLLGRTTLELDMLFGDDCHEWY